MKYKVLLLLLLLPLLSYGQVDLQKPFADCQLKGSTTIYDYKNKKWIFTDEADARRETLPASTFKIINSLIALETGAVKDEQEVLAWDGTEREISAWNADTDMEQAFRNSTVWFYVALAEKIGKDRYRKYLRKSRYGNGNIYTGQGADFWNYGQFGVTPMNQIELVRKLYEEKLPFSKRSFDIVKHIMIEEQGEGYVLRAKTGWTRYGGQDTGWWIGYIEKPDNVYFFATRLTKKRETENPNFSSCRKEITREVFRQLGILPAEL
jgi:beta-lactamase class D